MEDFPDMENPDDLEYFYPYSFLTDQRLMLEDKPRMDSYFNAIKNNPACFKNAIVLDVGCGTGVLSIWAAKAGAKKVYAVEATAMAQHAEVLAAHNGVSDIVTVFESKIEDVELPEKVDIIISEWMGLLLLREGHNRSYFHSSTACLHITC